MKVQLYKRVDQETQPFRLTVDFTDEQSAKIFGMSKDGGDMAVLRFALALEAVLRGE